VIPKDLMMGITSLITQSHSHTVPDHTSLITIGDIQLNNSTVYTSWSKNVLDSLIQTSYAAAIRVTNETEVL
jgi:hypothetical protein